MKKDVINKQEILSTSFTDYLNNKLDLIGQKTREDSTAIAQEFYLRGLSDITDENYYSAVYNFNNALRFEKSSTIYLSLSEVYLELKNPFFALESSINAYLLDSTSTQALEYMFELFSNFNDFEAAEKSIMKLYEINPTSEHLLQIADFFFYLQRTEAIELYEKYLNNNESNEVTIRYINALVNFGKTELAFEKLEKIIENSNFVDIYKIYTALSIQTGNLDKLDYLTQRSMEQSDEVKSKFLSNLISQLSYAKIDLKPYTIQIKRYLSEVKNKTFEDRQVNIDALYLSYNIKDSLLIGHFIPKVLVNVDTLEGLPIVCAQMYADIGEDEKALATLNKFKDVFTENDEYLLNIGFIYLKNNEYNKALAFLIKYKEKDSSNSERWLNVADLYSKMDDNGNAEYNYLRAIELEPKNSSANNNYAYFLSKFQNRLDDAEKFSYFSLELEKENPSFLDTYGWILYQKGKIDLGLDYIIKAFKIDSTNWEILDHLGIIYEKKGNIEEARKYWEKALFYNPKNQDLFEKLFRTK